MSEKTKKRERGANYSPEEKAMLADLITKYKYIIEDKRTGGHFLMKKKEAWKAITTIYNSNCTTGPRQTDQLKALYDNMKQKTRKNVGEKNKMEYINNNNEFVTKDDLSRALEHVKEDKVQIHKTGGGVWKPKVTDNDAKVLAIIQDQIEPLSNPYDSGAVYFKDSANIEITETFEIEAQDLELPTIDVNTIQTNDVSKELEPDFLNGPVVDIDYESLSAPTQRIGITSSVQDQQDPSQVILTSTPSRILTPARRKFVKSKDAATLRKRIIKPKTAESLKRIYFKKKCENAYLEKKKLMQEILHEKQQHNLKMLILKKKLNKNINQ